MRGYGRTEELTTTSRGAPVKVLITGHKLHGGFGQPMGMQS
jgi:hypothetical protein